MMSISDILQLIVLCALLFFPLGYLARHYQRRIRTTLRFVKAQLKCPLSSSIKMTTLISHSLY